MRRDAAPVATIATRAGRHGPSHRLVRATSSSLSDAFRSSVEVSLSRIESNPAAHAVSFETIRVALIQRFPYLIVYDFDESTIRVYAVVHAASDPQSWVTKR